jgi:hypothetical protein
MMSALHPTVYRNTPTSSWSDSLANFVLACYICFLGVFNEGGGSPASMRYLKPALA